MHAARHALLALLLLALTSSARAQVVATPDFTIGNAQYSVAVTAEHRGLFFGVADESGTYVRHLAGQDWTTTPALAPTSDFSLASFSAGATIVWNEQLTVHGRHLDVLDGFTGTFQLNTDDRVAVGTPRVALSSAATAIVWKDFLRADPPDRPLRVAIGTHRFAIPDTSSAIDWRVAALPSGEFVIVWTGIDETTEAPSLQAAVYDANGDTVVEPLAIGPTDLVVSGLATCPVGNVIAVVGRADASSGGAHAVSEIHAYRFDATGTALGPRIVVGTVEQLPIQSHSAILPDVAFDFDCDLLVVWGDDGPVTPGIHVRAYDPAGTPLAGALKVSTKRPNGPVHTARQPDGRFVNAWVTSTPNTVVGWADVVSLCAPGSAVCGDGVRVATCERCDEGAANDDAAPDACRTSCLPAHCGDGVTDSGEQCDDGNYAACDGCSPTCTLEPGVVCGDGITARSCGEHCDDGNAALLDGCTPSCVLERVPGGGAAKTDCLSEWSVSNPTNRVPRDAHGAITTKHACVDGDPRCDFDGGVAGSCTFRLQVCANNTDVDACTPSSRLAGWDVTRPSSAQAAKHPELAAVRTTLGAAVASAIVGPTDRDVCTDAINLVVPMRGTAGAYKATTLKLQATARTYEGAVDKDKLLLRCLP